MDDSMESVMELAPKESLREASFDFGSDPEGEPRFHASLDLREIGGEQAGTGDDSLPPMDELRESISSTLDASIAKFNDLLSRQRIGQQPRIFKLSDELLGLILGCVAEPQLSGPLPTIHLQWRPKRRQRTEEFIESVKAVQSLRLVCRRICTVSSPFLLPTVRVELSAQSLARLDMISRHPTIGRGVRTVRVVTRCWDRMPIDSLENFLHHKSAYLDEALDVVLSDDEEAKSRMNELYQRYILEGLGGRLTNVRLCRIFWNKAYERYKYLHAEQKILSEEDIFLEGVGTAVARMSRATALHICDRDSDNFYYYDPYTELRSKSKLLFDYYENEDVLIDDIIKSKLFGYEDYNEFYLRTDTSWSSPSSQILLKLPGAIHKAGKSLENMYIEIKCPSDHRTLTSFKNFQELSAATQRLKQFSFYCTNDDDDDLDGDNNQWTSTELDGLVQYLSAIMNTNALEKIDINLSNLALGLGNFNMKKQNPSVPSLGTVFSSRMWPNLRSIYLSLLPLHLSELETFIDNLKTSDIEMNIRYMYLISGSWSEGLEIFKRNSFQDLVLMEPILSSERRALLSSGKLFWDWDEQLFYWDYGHSLLKTRRIDY